MLLAVFLKPPENKDLVSSGIEHGLWGVEGMLAHLILSRAHLKHRWLFESLTTEDSSPWPHLAVTKADTRHLMPTWK